MVEVARKVRQKTMKIRITKARKSFRARHNCANPGPKQKQDIGSVESGNMKIKEEKALKQSLKYSEKKDVKHAK